MLRQCGGGDKKTLDTKHASFVKLTHQQSKRLEELRVLMCNIDTDLEKLHKSSRSEWTDADFDTFHALTDKKHEVRSAIQEMDMSTCNETEYYLRTGNILFNYYNARAKPSSEGEFVENNKILSYFSVNGVSNNGKANSSNNTMINNDTCVGKGIATTSTTTNNTDNDCSLHNPMYGGDSIVSPGDNRATLLEKYLSATSGNGGGQQGPVRHLISSYDNPDSSAADFGKCIYCGNESCTLLQHEGCVVCDVCNSVEYVLIDHDKPSYKDPPKDVACLAYKRINHLNEWLNQVQGKETTEINDEVFANILNEIKKQKITNMATLTVKKLRDILKKIDSNKYYEHIPHIMHRLNGIPALHMPPELEDKIRFMFCTIQIPFLKYQPPNRKNFLSYSYCLHKMMQLLEKDQYLASFPLLKSREKLYMQDQIWKKICHDVRWQFIPSL